jgi:hypothetical protein
MYMSAYTLTNSVMAFHAVFLPSEIKPLKAFDDQGQFKRRMIVAAQSPRTRKRCIRQFDVEPFAGSSRVIHDDPSQWTCDQVDVGNPKDGAPADASDTPDRPSPVATPISNIMTRKVSTRIMLHFEPRGTSFMW